MRLINLTCPNCGSQLQIDMDNKQARCDFCGNAILIDDGVQHIQYDNAEQAGYEFEKGRQRAKEEQRRKGTSTNTTYSRSQAPVSSGKYWQEPHPKKKSNSMALWVIMWIFCFPIPLTILLWRNKKLPPKIKYGTIAGLWVAVIIVCIISNIGNDGTEYVQHTDHSIKTEEAVEIDSNIESDTSTEYTETASEEISKEDYLDSFVEKFNSNSNSSLKYVESFTPQENNSSHYRVEFRLNAYNDSIGKSYSFGESSVDIISVKTIFKENYIRIYMDGASLQECKDMVVCASPLLDSNMNDSELNRALERIDKNESSFYYSKLGIALQKKGEDSYNIMIKQDL